mmetsp:Transcript_7575/g.16964  ORF Transcript_7575/g.16964 Transcript_7575/m.16964 type:complete len:125 (+) Transcript_7575:303-677(+)
MVRGTYVRRCAEVHVRRSSGTCSERSSEAHRSSKFRNNFFEVQEQILRSSGGHISGEGQRGIFSERVRGTYFHRGSEGHFHDVFGFAGDTELQETVSNGHDLDLERRLPGTEGKLFIHDLIFQI